MNRLYRTVTLMLTMSLIPTLGLAQLQPRPLKVYSGIPLLGTEEAPSNNSTGYGALTAIYDEQTTQFYYQFEWQLSPGNEATAVHFHGPATRGENASVVIDLGPISGNSGIQTGMLTLSNLPNSTQIDDLKAGLWYLNIHSDQFPSGEIRGQLVELSPLETASFFDFADQRVNMESLMVPTIGVLEMKFNLVPNSNPLLLELDEFDFKDLDSSDDADE